MRKSAAFRNGKIWQRVFGVRAKAARYAQKWNDAAQKGAKPL